MGWSVLLLLVGLGSWCVQGAALREIQGNNVEKDVNVNMTVQEVEEILGGDPSLPRLTRGEILSLIEEVKRERASKNLMVVLPVKSDSSGHLEDLYTMAPVTQMYLESGVTSSTTKRPKRKKKKPSPVYVHQSSSSSTTTTAPGSTTEDLGGWVPVESQGQGGPKLPESLQQTLDDISVRPLTEPPIFVTLGSTAKTTRAPQPFKLDPAMMDVLASFGLNPENTGTTSGTPAPEPETPAAPRPIAAPAVDPSSYVNFKPLPASPGADMSDDMKEFLASFGLVPGAARAEKAIPQPPTSTELNTDMLDDAGREVLEDMGVIRDAKKLKHVFNPSSLNTTREKDKIEKLLKRLRELSTDKRIEGMSQDELKELLLKGLGEVGVGQQSLLESAQPDPLSLEELEHLLALDKNEVKRQQPSASTTNTTVLVVFPASSTSSGDTTTTSTTTTTTTEESPAETTTESEAAEGTERSPSFDDLNESFGGDTSSTTTARPNGLYFFLDWNSFFDVGLDERRVNLQFNPKVGDPSLFLPVTVP